MDQVQDLYAILGVSKDCSEDDIKKAYRKLSLQYHPDKNHGDDETFKLLSNAYQILSDPKQRLIYDMTVKDEIPSSSLLSLFDKLLNVFMKVSKPPREKQENAKPHPVKPKDVSVTITVDLVEVYNSEIKKVLVKVKRNGQPSTETCYMQLLNYADGIRFNGMGDAIDEHPPSDIIINIKVNEHPFIKMDASKYDLYIDYNIGLYEYYYGIDVNIPFLNNEVLSVRKTFDKRLDYHGSNMIVGTLVFKEHGLPYTISETVVYGDLYIYFRLTLPSPTEVDQKDDALKNILRQYYKGNAVFI